ncbi:hypothetical protein BR93DRAFT_318875 [Coniochaeta sp. PMI_546]|nr:hypothetical protein BR93DRAFT_318875 [Coniochaeta sp. PMI_546]
MSRNCSLIKARASGILALLRLGTPWKSGRCVRSARILFVNSALHNVLENGNAAVHQPPWETGCRLAEWAVQTPLPHVSMPSGSCHHCGSSAVRNLSPLWKVGGPAVLRLWRWSRGPVSGQALGLSGRLWRQTRYFITSLLVMSQSAARSKTILVVPIV